MVGAQRNAPIIKYCIINYSQSSLNCSHKIKSFQYLFIVKGEKRVENKTVGNSREGDSKINTKQKKYAISALPVKNLEKNPHMRKR